MVPATKTFKTLFTFDTEYCADSIEWCPHFPYQNIFVCGNYQYTEGERLGRLLSFSVSSETGLDLLQKIELSAVLDLKWCPGLVNGVPLLGVATAKNAVKIYSLKNSNLELLSSCDIEGNSGDILILSLDWSSSRDPMLVCSDSGGKIHLTKLENENLIHEIAYNGHGYEAWIAAFYYWDPNIFFSGGDDALFLQFDRRVEKNPVVKNRTHEAGVTAIHSNKSKEFIIVTGSYDEHVRLWDIRSLKNPVDSLKVPGPLWRLKFDPFSQNFILAACMLGGVHVIDSRNDEMKIKDSYYEHKNIAYGADWCHLINEGEVMIGSCSFYDHLLCISEVTV